MANEKGRVFVGARARFSVNGKPVGYATECSGQETLEHVPVEVLDNIEVEEHVAVRYRVSFSAQFVRLVGETAKSRGHFPKLGANKDEHLKNILTSGVLTVSIEDTQTQKIVAMYEQCKAASNNWNVAAGTISGHNMEFVAIRARDESET